MNVTKLPTANNDSDQGPRRSTPNQGEQCFIYVLGRADQHADSMVPSYGQISAGCGPNIGEDFADTMWPVVVKFKPSVTRADLVQHLRDLADNIEGHVTQIPQSDTDFNAMLDEIFPPEGNVYTLSRRGTDTDAEPS